jgi:hypothetical protein
VSDVAVQPLQWLTLQDINEVRPIDGSDAACLLEIRDVLEKHGALDRFGVSLLHSHFDVADYEMMLETTNVANREHWVRPVKKADLVARGLVAQTTILRFDKEGYSQNCGCATDKDGHTGGHSS